MKLNYRSWPFYSYQHVAIQEVKDLQLEGVRPALSGDGRYDSPGKLMLIFIKNSY